MSWQPLEPWLNGTDGLREPPPVRDALAGVIRAQAPADRRRSLDALLEALRNDGGVAPFLGRLAAAEQPAAHRLALTLAARLPLPLERPAAAALPGLLRDRRQPVPLRLAAATALLRSHPDPAAADQALRALVAGLGRPAALKRLEQLRKLAGNHPALDAFVEHLTAGRPMTCPRCGVTRPRPELVKHLWQEHRLMLAGRRVRQPWDVVRDWLTDYARSNDRELLERGCDLGQQLDPAGGLVRVQRLMLEAGAHDREALDHLRDEARRRSASLCPHCYALVTGNERPSPPPLPPAHGRIARDGYLVQVSDRGLLTRLALAWPRGVHRRGREPGRPLTRRGALVVRCGPWAVAALTLAVLWPAEWVPLAVVVVLLLIASGLYLHGMWRWRAEPPADDRATDYAWSLLVPQLHAGGYSPEDAEFLAALAQASARFGHPSARERPLARVVRLTEQAVAAGQPAPALLAPLWRLELGDAARAGRDPVLPLAEHLGRCLKGELPLICAERLLGDAECKGVSAGTRGRLRVLLCAQAFEAGLGVSDLAELGRVAPVLGRTLGSADADGLARLWLLWSMRPARPWQRCGPAVTVFDLARYPMLGGEHLEAQPDLLLFQPTADDGRDDQPASPILVTGSGLVYRDAVISEKPAAFEVKSRNGRGYELVAGKARWTFAVNPAPLAHRLEAWADFLFREFLPREDQALGWHSAEALAKLFVQRAVDCPECGQVFLRRTGEVGIPAGGGETEQRPATPPGQPDRPG
jgi:hypothetical protein